MKTTWPSSFTNHPTPPSWRTGVLVCVEYVDAPLFDDSEHALE
jgi:hypothetical protein